MTRRAFWRGVGIGLRGFGPLYIALVVGICIGYLIGGWR